jgi:hypothetical protein
VSAIDVRRLRPSELCRLLNSTPLGEVISERHLYRHRMRAGLRIGDGKRVDLFRYMAWVREELQKRRAERDQQPADPYARSKEVARARNAAISEAGRDIGELPAVADPKGKQRAESDFRWFCESYFPQTFYLPWSPDHLKVIAKIEEAVMQGGLFAMAMSRGNGKSSVVEAACLWAMLFGHREFVCLIGSDEAHAVDMLESIKTELDSNDLLLEDFPEVCYPIRRLEGIANRCSGQLYCGERTHIGWTAKEIVLPTIAGSPASGAIIRVAGITGRIRGMKYKRPDGRSVRPSLVIIDDPQTDESARSLSQCEHRESILAGAILGLAGPGRKISGIMPCTVIRPGDMADSILDRGKHPEWNGERTKLVYSFPSNTRLWQQYAELRADGFRSGDHGRAATEFYRERRDEMDAGAVVAWPERFNPDELSAIQHAMNLRLRDEAAFQAEYQNEPLPDVKPEDDLLTAEQIAAKTNGHARRIVPVGATRLTAFIDVQQKLLYYVVCAWADDFTGYVIDYGTYPDQRMPYFTLREATLTLTDVAAGTGLEGSIYAGLESLCEDLLSREWRQDNGSALRIERLLIDANWGSSTDVVYQFCRQSKHAAILMPSHGRYVGASSLPFAEYRRKPGDRIGHNWRIPATTGRRTIRYTLYDTNFWKSFLQARLHVSMGDRGCLSLFGRGAEQHRGFAEHLTAEYRVRTSGRGREVDEWKLRPEASDNHWLDCLVGACVGASMQGVELLRAVEPRAQPRKRLRLSSIRGDFRRW